MARYAFTDGAHPGVGPIAQYLENLGHDIHINDGQDLTTEPGLRAFCDAAGRLDGLIISGYALVSGAIGEGDVEDMIAATSKNINSAFMAARILGARMVERGGGSIVILSSLHADKPTGSQAGYAIAQGALKMMTRELGLYYGNQGVRVNMVKLPPLEEEMESFDSSIVKINHAASLKQPIGRHVLADDAAALTALLLSPESAGINGEDILVDGGLRLHYFDRAYASRKEADLWMDL